MAIIKETTLEKATASTYNTFSCRSTILKEYRRIGHINNIRPSLLNYKINLEENTWVTSGFLIARYGPFDLFVNIAPKILNNQLTSDGFTLLYALASSEVITALCRLTKFFEMFPGYNTDVTDQYRRSPLHYSQYPAVYNLLIQHGAIADKPGMMHPFEYMTVRGNRTIFCLASDHRLMVQALLEHGTTSVSFARTVISHIRGEIPDETARAILVHFGMLNLFSESAFNFFEQANAAGANVPINNDIFLFDYCCDYLKDKSPGRVKLAISAIHLDNDIGLLGDIMTVAHAETLRHRAYMLLARIVLQEEPTESYSLDCGVALSTQQVKRHCTLASRSERLEIAKAMVEVPVQLPDKLLWYVNWISTAYELELEEEGKTVYHPIVYKLTKMKDEFRQNALHVVCSELVDVCKFEFFKLLVEMGIELDARDSNGYTPLFQLVDAYRMQSERKKIKMAEFLLEKGAHIDVPDKRRKVNVRGKLSEMINRIVLPSLQCLCAKILQDHRQSMKKKLRTLPPQMREFVEMH